jgi:hypothetical protein
MRHKRLCQRERSKMVCRERHVAAQRVLRGAHREDARVIEQPGDRELERDDLRSRPPHAGKIRQVTHDRNRVLTLLLDGLLHLGELSRVAADQDNCAVLGQFECREAAYAGGWASDDVSVTV